MKINRGWCTQKKLAEKPKRGEGPKKLPLAQEKSADKKVCHQGKPSADNDSFEKKGFKWAKSS